MFYNIGPKSPSISAKNFGTFGEHEFQRLVTTTNDSDKRSDRQTMIRPSISLSLSLP